MNKPTNQIPKEINNLININITMVCKQTNLKEETMPMYIRNLLATMYIRGLVNYRDNIDNIRKATEGLINIVNRN